MASSIVGVAFESGRVRAVEVESWRSSRPKVVRVGEERLLASSFVGGAIVEPGDIRDALVRLFANGDFASNDVVLVLDGRQTMVRRSLLPNGTSSELRAAAAFDIEELLGYELKEAIFDVAPVRLTTRDGVDWMSTLVVAVHQPDLESLQGIATAADLRPVATHSTAEALVRSIRSSWSGPESQSGAPTSPGDSGPETLVALISVGDSETDIVIRDHGGVVFSRTLASGVGEAESDSAEELESHLRDLAADSAQTWLAASGAGARKENASFDRIGTGVEKTLRYYQTDVDSRELSQIILSGPRATVSGLHEHLSQTLRLEVHLSVAPDSWPVDDHDWHGYERAYGAVLCQSRTQGGVRRTFNLTPWAEQRRRQDHKRRLVTMALTLLVVALVTSLTWAQRQRIEIARDQLDEAASSLSDLEAAVSEFDELALSYSQVNVGASQADQLLASEIGYAVVLQEVASVMPADAELVSVQMRRVERGETVAGTTVEPPVALVTISGLATDLASISDVLAAISSTTLVEGAWLTQTSASPDLGDGSEASFSIEAVLTSRAQPMRTAFDRETN